MRHPTLSMKEHKIVVVTPAGRRRYLEILSRYVLRDESIDEWHLWDNCRDETDRAYIRKLASENEKVVVVEEPGVDGTNRSVSRFYKYTRNPEAFFIKLDDDIVYLPDHFGLKLYAKALAEKERCSWWSPLVINNAICTYLLREEGVIRTKAPLTAQANCPIAWGSPLFARNLHETLLNTVRDMGSSWEDIWKLSKDYPIFLQRFSINAIGFFGELSAQLGDDFCPENADDEEHISARLPLLTGKPGCLVGGLLAVHFSFHTQENYLLKTALLEEYSRLAGLSQAETALLQGKNGVGEFKSYGKWIKRRLADLMKSNLKVFLNEILGYYFPRQIEHYRVDLGKRTISSSMGKR